MPETPHKHLLDSATFPDRTETVEFRETHISKVYLTDTRAYKFKKPLNLGFLDFVSLDSRKHFCHEELRLNRRFCPDIYLDVVSLNRDDAEFRINGPGEPVDYAVMMRRLPEDRMLDRLLGCGESIELPSEIDRLAEKLTVIYPTLPPCHEKGDRGHVELMRTNWRENFSQTRPYIGRTIDSELFETARQRVERLFNEYGTVMEQRERDGYIRDCHGDLHSGNICMTDEICIYDCIEFNRRFRIGDIAGDIAFLLMDLDFRGHHALGDRLLNKAMPILGDPEEVAQLIPFYKFYRAWVRGKVQSFLLDEEEVDETLREKARQQAVKYFNLALGTQAPEGLILTCGLMGSGKTTVARALAAATGARLLRSDVIRKELFGRDGRRSAAAAFNEGIYTADKTARTYEELCKRAGSALGEKRLVIADASFRSLEERRRFQNLAESRKIPFLILHVECSGDLALSRLDQRKALGRDASDGRRELYRHQAAVFEEPSGEETKIDVDTSQSVDYNVSLILLQYLKLTGTT